jgi:NADH-quinone oxidoreductase subunit M
MSIVALVLGKKLTHNMGWLVFCVFLYTTLLSLVATAQVVNGEYLTETYAWAPRIGLVLGFRADGLSIPLVLTISFISMAISLYSVVYMKNKIQQKTSEYGVYYALYLLFVASMLGAVLSTNLIEFFIFYEFMLIPSYFLIAKWGYGEREKISLMYFLWTHVGALFLLVGILSTYALVGSFNIYEIPRLIEQIKPPLELMVGISSLMFVAFFVKMALLGLHVWLPHVHAEAPTPISSLLSPAMIGIGGYAAIRTTMTFFPIVSELARDILSVWALGTMIYGGILALTQDDLKRRLAYSSISQMGYILLGVSAYNVVGISGSMFHYVSHGICKALLFMVAGVIILQADGLRSIKKLGGLASKMPITAVAAIVGFFGIMGVPPLNGFHSEWMIFSGMFVAAINSGSLVRLVIASGSILATILTACYGVWTIQQIFFGSRPEYLDNVKEAPLTVTLPLLALIIAAIFLGLFPSAILDPLSRTIASIFG